MTEEAQPTESLDPSSVHRLRIVRGFARFLGGYVLLLRWIVPLAVAAMRGESVAGAVSYDWWWAILFWLDRLAGRRQPRDLAIGRWLCLAGIAYQALALLMTGVRAEAFDFNLFSSTYLRVLLLVFFAGSLEAMRASSADTRTTAAAADSTRGWRLAGVVLVVCCALAGALAGMRSAGVVDSRPRAVVPVPVHEPVVPPYQQDAAVPGGRVIGRSATDGVLVIGIVTGPRPPRPASRAVARADSGFIVVAPRSDVEVANNCDAFEARLYSRTTSRGDTLRRRPRYATATSGIDAIIIPSRRLDREGVVELQLHCSDGEVQVGWVCIVDHPYAQALAADTPFAIEDVPAGQHELVVMRQATGGQTRDEQRQAQQDVQLTIERRSIAVDPGATIDLGLVGRTSDHPHPSASGGELPR